MTRPRVLKVNIHTSPIGDLKEGKLGAWVLLTFTRTQMPLLPPPVVPRLCARTLISNEGCGTVVLVHTVASLTTPSPPSHT